MLGFFKPSSAMVQQLLCSAGYDDPKVMRLVERIMDEGFKTPTLMPFAGTDFPVPQGAETLVIRAENAVEEMTLLVYVRRKTGENR